MSKRCLSLAVRHFVAAAALVTACSLAPQASAAPADDRDPGIAGRIERIVAKVIKAIVPRLVPQDGLTWPKP